MTAVPAAGYFTAGGRTNTQAKQGQDDMLAVTRELLGGEAESTLVLAGDAAVPTRAIHSIDTEGAAAADNLRNLTTTNHPDGRLLLIRCANAARVVTVKHNSGGAGQIALADGADFVLDNAGKWLLLKRTGADWQEVTRAFGSDKAAARTYLGTAALPIPVAADPFRVPQVKPDFSGYELVGPLHTFRNLLINGGFDVAQSGAAATARADDAYGLDRWYVLTQTASVNDEQLSGMETDGLYAGRLTQNQVAAQRMGRAQVVEGKNCKHLRGQTAVLSGRVRISTSQAVRYAILEWTGTEDAVTSDVVNNWTSGVYTAGNFFLAANLTVAAVGAITPQANTWTDIEIAAAISANLNNLIAFVWTEGTAAQNLTLDMRRFQLELGPERTAFEQRRYENELALCQRYVLPLAASGTSAVIGMGGSFGASQGWAMIPTPVEMRATPTLSGTIGMRVNGGSYTMASPTLAKVANGIRIEATITGAAANYGGWLANMDAGGTNYSVSLTAEL